MGGVTLARSTPIIHYLAQYFESGYEHDHFYHTRSCNKEAITLLGNMAVSSHKEAYYGIITRVVTDNSIKRLIHLLNENTCDSSLDDDRHDMSLHHEVRPNIINILYCFLASGSNSKERTIHYFCASPSYSNMLRYSSLRRTKITTPSSE